MSWQPPDSDHLVLITGRGTKCTCGKPAHVFTRCGSCREVFARCGDVACGSSAVAAKTCCAPPWETR